MPDGAAPASAPAGGAKAFPDAYDPEQHTTSFSIVDGFGNALAVTPTLGGLFGNRVVVGSTGLLLNNGIRAGVIGSVVPDAIDHVLHQRDSTPDADQSRQTKKNADLTTEPIVHGHLLRARRNQRTDIQASEEYASMPLLVSGDAELGGHTYQQAKAVYCLRVDPQPDRTALVELTPEIQHGAPRLRFTTGDDGILKQASLNERKVFDQLQLAVRLAPGEMLVLMSLPDSGSRLGHYFHTVDSADGPQQKLILIRLAQVPPSDTFATKP
jgi:hypothetical protein